MKNVPFSTPNSLTELEEQLETSYVELGRAFLELAETEGRQIDRLVDEIIEKKQLLLEKGGDSVEPCCQCPACLKNAHDRYCRHCGHKQGHAALCPNCKAVDRQKDLYCHACGGRLGDRPDETALKT